MRRAKTSRKTQTASVKGIAKITVSGYKSISDEQSIDIKPLTILAGANSSGKSSIMQPLLLLKQTLEVSYDPGALLINGPNVRFTSVEQLLSRRRDEHNRFCIGIQTEHGHILKICFSKSSNKKGFEIKEVTLSQGKRQTVFYPGIKHKEILATLPTHLKELSKAINREQDFEWTVIRKRCFLLPALTPKNTNDRNDVLYPFLSSLASLSDFADVEPYIRALIHLPGLRGNPERTYPVTAVGSTFPGTFEKYTASVIAQWQTDEKTESLGKLGEDLEGLGLTCAVGAEPIDDTQVELRVGRLPYNLQDSPPDMVNIADVGFGVSQTLPILVALHTAEQGQLVYLEQPEIHLHPRAQVAMAQVLADAAKRGVRVVAETHSNLLLLGIQTLVAEGKLSPELVKLHWFQRDEDGVTRIDSADLDESGAFGNWSEDFGQVALEAESRYLDAVEALHDRNK